MSTIETYAGELPHKLRAVAAGLLQGLGEKQVALRTGLRPHTVHSYAKEIYKHYGVSNRHEYMALWIRMSPSDTFRGGVILKRPAAPEAEAVHPPENAPHDTPDSQIIIHMVRVENRNITKTPV